jgi:hypothetical protein
MAPSTRAKVKVKGHVSEEEREMVPSECTHAQQVSLHATSLAQPVSFHAAGQLSCGRSAFMRQVSLCISREFNSVARTPKETSQTAPHAVSVVMQDWAGT